MPRVAIYSQWSGTQELGWYRHAFDQFGIPFDLIFKERVEKGNLKNDYDVIIMAAQNVNRAAVLAPKAAQARSPIKKTRQVQVPRHVRRDGRHQRRLRPGRASTRSRSSSTRAAR